MANSTDELIERLRSNDVDEQGLALEALVRQGKAAVPALQAALQNSEGQVRALAAEGLGQLADPTSADALANAVQDEDECVRAQAAVALSRLKDPRAVWALLDTLNDCEDILHAHLSPSAYALMGMEPDVLPAVAPLLKAANEPSRTKAIWIMREIVSDMPGVDWPELWRDLGSYDPEGPAAEREAAAEQWLAWVDGHVKGA